jgi:hypothetical protein
LAGTWQIPDIQRKLLANNGDLKFPDRVAHQYQIAGSRVVFQVATDLPEALRDVGLFKPDIQHCGIGRISTGLGTPHVETNPDFLGIMVAFQTSDGQRVDFLGINNPTAPTNDHREFMSVPHATGESAEANVPFIGKLGAHELVNLGAQQTEFGVALGHRMGVVKASETLLHLTKQTLPTALSSTAYQRYWTGGKFTFVPTREENHALDLHAGSRHLTDEWENRQARGDMKFQLFWIPFLSEEKTPTKVLTHPWQEDHKQLAGVITFAKTDLDSEDAKLWAILATEMGANPGNWVADKSNSIQQPASEFGVARKIAYQKKPGRSIRFGAEFLSIRFHDWTSHSRISAGAEKTPRREAESETHLPIPLVELSQFQNQKALNSARDADRIVGWCRQGSVNRTFKNKRNSPNERRKHARHRF